MAATAVPVGWPRGFPCRVKTDVRSISGFLPVTKGTNAKVLDTHVLNEEQRVCIQLASGKVGWVPAFALDIGRLRKVGDIGFDIGGPPEWTSNNTTVYPNRRGLTFTTIKSLLLSYTHIRANLPLDLIYVRDRLNTAERQDAFAHRICKGIDLINVDLRPLLDTGSWDWRDLYRYCGDGRKSLRVGIYLLIHEDFCDTTGKPIPRGAEVYTGSTGENFQARFYKHSGIEGWGNPAPTSPHYRTATKAKKHHYFPICYFDNQDTEKSELKIAEQIFIDLFQTYCPTVLDLQSFDDVDGDTDASASATRNAMRSGRMSSNDAQARAAKYLDDKHTATTFAKNANNVFAECGWPGAVRRTGPGNKSFGAVRGLNWSMPVTELQFEKQTWIRSDNPGRFANFRRVSYISSADDARQRGRKKIWQLNTTGKGDSNVAFYLPQNEPGPSYGTKVHVVCEIRLDDQSCGIPWARVPTVGAFSDWADASKFAMRIEWQDENGNWLFKHLQTEYYNIMAEDSSKREIPGSSNSYRIATGVKAYLLRESRPQTESLPWLYDFGIASVKEIYFDFLTQNVCTRRVSEKSVTPPIRRLTEAEIAQQLLNKGAECYAHLSDQSAADHNKNDTGFPVPPQYVGATRWSDVSTSGGRPRRNCDYCYLMHKKGGLSANKVPCKDDGTRRCAQCRKLGRPCTFTRESILLRDDALVNAIYNPPKKHTAVKSLPAGRITFTY